MNTSDPNSTPLNPLRASALAFLGGLFTGLAIWEAYLLVDRKSNSRATGSQLAEPIGSAQLSVQSRRGSLTLRTEPFVW